MAKRRLTLTVDEEVVARAHAYSAARQTSVSQLVTDYLAALGRAAESGGGAYTPVVRRLLGIVACDAVPEDYRDAYRRHLDAKYTVDAPTDAPAADHEGRDGAAT